MSQPTQSNPADVIRQLQAQGVHHFAWYPDDFIADQPSTRDARAAMSAGTFPYPEK